MSRSRVRIARLITVVCLSLSAGAAPRALAQTVDAVEPFQFFANDFWLNLHSFLYVLGRNELPVADRTRRAVVDAPLDAGGGLDRADAQDRRVWATAVAFYASGPSTRDTVFDLDLARVTKQLADAGDAPVLPPVTPAIFTPQWRAVLEQAAPIYRRVFWPQHQRANAARVAMQRALVARHGRAILATITRAYGQPWLAGGYPVHLSAYANWAGAYSTDLGTLVVSSLDPGTAALSGTEILFHEAMHQWDRPMAGLFATLSAGANVKIPDGFSHALIFYTAGEAVRRVAADHVPYAIANGLWPRLGLPIKDALDQAWAPWLDGVGARDAALTNVLRAAVRRTSTARLPSALCPLP